MARLRSASVQPQQRLTPSWPPERPSPAHPPPKPIEPAPAPQYESAQNDDTTDMQSSSSTVYSPAAVRKPSPLSEIEHDKSETATPEAACAKLIAERERLGDGPAILDIYRVLWAQHARPPTYSSSALDLLLDAATTEFLTKQLEAELASSDRRTRRSMDRLIGLPWSRGRQKSRGINNDILLTRLQLFAIFSNHGRFLEKLAKLADTVTESNISWEAMVLLLRRASDSRHDGAPAGVRQTKRNGKTGIGRGISTGAEWATKDVDMVQEQLATRTEEDVAGHNESSQQSIPEPVWPSTKRPLSKQRSTKRPAVEPQPDWRQDLRDDSQQDSRNNLQKDSSPEANGSTGSPSSVELGRKAVQPLSDFGFGFDSPDSIASSRRPSSFSFFNSPMLLQDFDSRTVLQELRRLSDEGNSSLGFGFGFRDWQGDRTPTFALSPSHFTSSTNLNNVFNQPEPHPPSARLHPLADASARAPLELRPPRRRPRSHSGDSSLRCSTNNAPVAPIVNNSDLALHQKIVRSEPGPDTQDVTDPQDDTSLQKDIDLQHHTSQDRTGPQDDIIGNFDDEPSVTPESDTTTDLPPQDTATTVKAARASPTESKWHTTRADTTWEASITTAEMRLEKRPLGESNITGNASMAKKPRFEGPRKASRVTNQEAQESIGHVREIFDLAGLDTTSFAPDAVAPRKGPGVAGFADVRGEDAPKSVFILPLPVAASGQPVTYDYHWVLCEYTVEEGQPFMGVYPYTAAPQSDADLKERFEGMIASDLQLLLPTDQTTGLLFEWDFSSSYNETVTPTILDDAPYYLAAKAIFRARGSKTSLPSVVNAPIWRSILTRTLSWHSSPHDAWSLDTFRPALVEEPDDSKPDDRPTDGDSNKEEPSHLQDLAISDNHLHAALSRLDREQDAFNSAAEALGLWWELLTELLDQNGPANEDLQKLSQKRANAQKEWEATNEPCFQQSLAFYTKQLRTHGMSQVKASCADMKSNIERRMKRTAGDKAKEISRALDVARKLTDKWQQMLDQHS
ncbi:Hypothetical predicted protein [Lecanosticta acicola]|uniref:Uncharacterized protein n=1 Tax=Lecanosticta acicola TaxID=111012 RepID=A0AAI9E8W1_9PEZI|nr:Hypothetical predicted protein [Lecanosticta acicola]